MRQDEFLFTNLHRYRQMALKLGMTDAKIIPASSVIIDPRVQMKCKYPRCGYYGSNGNCPPYAIPSKEMQECVDRYRFGLFLMKQFPSEELLGEIKSDKGNAKPGDSQRIMFNAVAKIEAAAFRDGYALAAGFANGPCKKLFCPNVACSAIEPGGKCRVPLKSRSSMEGVGMHVFRMAKESGWELIPAGHTSTSEQVAHLMCLGLVLVD